MPYREVSMSYYYHYSYCNGRVKFKNSEEEFFEILSSKGIEVVYDRLNFSIEGVYFEVLKYENDSFLVLYRKGDINDKKSNPMSGDKKYYLCENKDNDGFESVKDLFYDKLI